MNELEAEINKCITNGYQLKFKIPTEKELEKMRLIHRDRTESEKREIKKTQDMIAQLTKKLEKGEMDPASLPGISALLKALGVSEDEDE